MFWAILIFGLEERKKTFWNHLKHRHVNINTHRRNSDPSFQKPLCANGETKIGVVTWCHCMLLAAFAPLNSQTGGTFMHSVAPSADDKSYVFGLEEREKIPLLMKRIFGFLSKGKHMPCSCTWTLFSRYRNEEEVRWAGNLARTFNVLAGSCRVITQLMNKKRGFPGHEALRFILSRNETFVLN